jgi:hypothetical protein
MPSGGLTGTAAAPTRTWPDQAGAVSRNPIITAGRRLSLTVTMADAFISGVDRPYKQVDVVKSSGSAATLKAQMWQQYTRDITPAADWLFRPSVKDRKSQNYQFYLQYLKLLDLIKQHTRAPSIPCRKPPLSRRRRRRHTTAL